MRLWWALVLCATPRVSGFFGWGSSDEEGLAETDKQGCVAFHGVKGCHAKSHGIEPDGSLDRTCHATIGPRTSGVCQCAWGRTEAFDCNHPSFSCTQLCFEEFPAGDVEEGMSWLKGTVWHWNNWREVKLEADGIFLAPTEDCMSEECFWTARDGKIFIMWGHAGLHTVKIDDSKKLLEGIRFDGEPCMGKFVRSEASHEEDGDDEGDDLDDQDLYEVLGLDPEDATDASIKKAFRKLSKEYHPDRVKQTKQDPEKAAMLFEKVRAAYEILSDADKRMLYDTGGMEAVKEHVENEGRAERGGRGPFGMFGFGGGGPSNRGRDQEYLFEVSLEHLYSGETVKTKINRRVVCRGCSKITNKNRERCSKCGKCPPEVRMVQRQMGGFLVQQQEQVPSKEKCKQEAAELEVVLEKGMSPDERLVFPRMAEQTPGKLPGDIVLIIKQKDHEQFARHGNDLATVVHVPLKNALTGFSHTFSHLDGHTIELETDPASNAGHIIFPEQQRRLKGEGMPVHNVPSESGDLLVTFEVLFPKHLTKEQMEKLRNIL